MPKGPPILPDYGGVMMSSMLCGLQYEDAFQKDFWHFSEDFIQANCPVI